MKKIVSILFLLLCTTCAFAQKSTDILYLKNGSIIRGAITEMIPDSIIKIKTSDGSLFVYPMSDVNKLTKETLELENSKLKRGYLGMAEMSYGYCIDDGRGCYAISTVQGYQFNKYIFLGGGIHFDAIDEIFAFMCDARFTMDKSTAPFLDLRVGLDIEELGCYISPAIGCRIPIKHGFAISPALTSNMSTGYCHANVCVRVGFEW